MDINQFKRTIWHKYPEQPDPDRLILLYNGIKSFGIDYDIGYFKQIGKPHKFIYMEDILLPDMIKALHKQEKELEQEFS